MVNDAMQRAPKQFRYDVERVTSSSHGSSSQFPAMRRDATVRSSSLSLGRIRRFLRLIGSTAPKADVYNFPG